MIKIVLSKLVSFAILPIAILSVQRFSANPIGNTTFWWLIQFLILVIYGIAGYYFLEKENKRDILIVKIYILWNIFSVIRGIFLAETYWDIKGLIGNTFALLIPIVVYTASNKERLQAIMSVFVKFALPIAPIILIFIPIGAWGWYLFPITFLILFLPTYKLHWKVILVFIAVTVVLGDLSARSHVIKYAIPFLLLLLYYFRFLIASDQVIKIIRKVFIIAPWVLFVLGVSGIFNVFQIKEYIKTSFVAKSTNAQGEQQSQDITKDSRTFIYTEVLNSAYKHNYWLLGRSPARGNDTYAFADEIVEITGRRERLRNETGVPNVFTWTGIIGVILYFLVFLKASALAVGKSNNIYSKLVGLFVAFRWLYGWVEDDFSFSMNTVMIWLMIGICFSKSFREMNNAEFKLWARGIFKKNYVNLLRYLNREKRLTISKIK